MKTEKIELRKEIQFNELDNYAEIPRGSVFNVLYWQTINGNVCPIVDCNPFVDSIVYFTDEEYKKI